MKLSDFRGEDYVEEVQSVTLNDLSQAANRYLLNEPYLAAAGKINRNEIESLLG